MALEMRLGGQDRPVHLGKCHGSWP
jgi:hypothetical protein